MDQEKRHLYLAGFRGTGKSTLARRLSQRLELPWVDLDAQIQLSAGQTIDQIFSSAGEPGFRDLEEATLSDVSAQSQQIIALGGGAILREANRLVIARTGLCVRLLASAEAIHQRIQTDEASSTQRPPLTDLSALDEVRKLLEVRRPLYEQVSQYDVDTEQHSLDELTELVATWWHEQE